MTHLHTPHTYTSTHTQTINAGELVQLQYAQHTAPLHTRKLAAGTTIMPPSTAPSHNTSMPGVGSNWSGGNISNNGNNSGGNTSGGNNPHWPALPSTSGAVQHTSGAGTAIQGGAPASPPTPVSPGEWLKAYNAAIDAACTCIRYVVCCESECCGVDNDDVVLIMTMWC